MKKKKVLFLLVSIMAISIMMYSCGEGDWGPFEYEEVRLSSCIFYTEDGTVWRCMFSMKKSECTELGGIWGDACPPEMLY